MKTRFVFNNKREFRDWLEDNCETSEPIWIEFYKDGTKIISYNDALDVALSYGWIDSLIKKIDERVYVRKFSKRSPASRWSEANKKRVARLIKTGEMTEHGSSAVEEAKRNGQWSKGDEREEIIDVEGLRDILKDSMDDISQFDQLTDSLKRHYSLVYFAAKKEETRQKRLEKILEYMKTRKRFM